MPTADVPAAFARLVTWLERYAPRTRASLRPPATDEQLAQLARDLGDELPEDFLALYRQAAGQDDSAPVGLFEGSHFMPFEGVDGLKGEWGSWLGPVEGGAEDGPRTRFPFAKDFSGNFFLVDTAPPGGIFELEDGVLTRRAPNMAAFLDALAADLEEGRTEIDERIEKLTEHEIVFDAARPRTPGERVTHSVFERLGAEAAVRPLDYFHIGEAPPFGFVVEVAPGQVDLEPAGPPTLLGPNRAPLRGVEIGWGRRGGQREFVVYVRAKHPLPEGSRLHLRLHERRWE